MDFRGNFPAKVDAQGRLKIPTAHRRILEDKYGLDVYVTSTFGDHVRIYPMNQWERIELKLKSIPGTPPFKDLFLRNTGYFGQMATVDKQGRVMIQPLLREKAQIDGEVSVIGYLTYLVVWSQAPFTNQIEKEKPLTDEHIADLAKYGI